MSENVSKNLQRNIWETDLELYSLIKKQKKRQKAGLEMVASANYASLPVLQCLGSCLHNKNSECVPGQRHHGGTEIIDSIELLCQKRALEAFNLSSVDWGCNVQPYSGSPANLASLIAVAPPSKDPTKRRLRVMGLHVPHGGHFTHGYDINGHNRSGTSMFFETLAYKVDPKSGLIDYDSLAKAAGVFRPHILIAGVSCYSRVLDYKRFRQIADEIGAYLLADMAHIAGLVAAGVTPSPFEYSDIVTSTTHKSLRGPRAGVIFYRKGIRHLHDQEVPYDLEDRINHAVFPGLQGGAHNNTIAAIATAMLQAKTTEFLRYQQQVVKNAKRLENGLRKRGYRFAADGTDIHLLLVDLSGSGITGEMAEVILEEVNISCSKNHVPTDSDMDKPSGLRLGTPAITTRGLKESDMDKVVDFIDRGLKLAKEAIKICTPEITDFIDILFEDPKINEKLKSLRKEIENFSDIFPLPGYPQL